MLSSGTFNSTKFNSVFIPQAVVPPTGGGGSARIRVDKRKRRLLRREFINIVGTKLFFNREFIDIIGTKLVNDKQFSDIISSVLLPVETKVNLTAKVLSKNAQDLLVLKGKVQYPIKIETKLVGAKKFSTCMYRIVKGKRLILSKQLELIYGKKLVLSTEHKVLRGFRKVPCKQINMICGQKDISEILEALDMPNKEE